MAAMQIAEVRGTHLHTQKLISDHVVAVFSKSYCPYCSRAKQVISGLNLSAAQVGTVELDQTNEGADIQAYLQQKTGQRTVPNIFVHGQHLGGCDDLLRAQQNGELEKLLGKL
ncbi:hypothetical protein MEQU1_003536 [Malassezia equina]|uniref:glutathione peroxidase n=1 Tax=Malassezia equina TaxID=1381935 RepID=A0AAF0EHT9_9BASI|nr:hypothetical protein MEQU1_003536 [Malassezia equina]